MYLRLATHTLLWMHCPLDRWWVRTVVVGHYLVSWSLPTTFGIRHELCFTVI